MKVGSQILLPIPRRKVGSKAVVAKTMDKRRKVSFNHTVVSGETVWIISRRYGVSAKDILSLNGLSASTTIYPGKRLRIHR
jgi:membrane-bound lytic murein transglycosylase D